MKKWSFQKVHFQKVECLVKAVKKYFLKKLSVWLAIIKVAVWKVNYQKGQCIYKRVYFILKSTISILSEKKKKIIIIIYIIGIILIMFR